MELKEYRFDEVTDNFDKKRIPLSSAQRKKRQGKYRYYGAQGVIDHIDDFIFDGTYLLIAEDGENLKSKKQNIAQVVDGQFWVNNHAHIVQGNELCDTRYLCYLLNSMDLSGYVTGSAQPKLSQANLNAVTLLLPTISGKLSCYLSRGSLILNLLMELCHQSGKLFLLKKLLTSKTVMPLRAKNFLTNHLLIATRFSNKGILLVVVGLFPMEQKAGIRRGLLQNWANLS